MYKKAGSLGFSRTDCVSDQLLGCFLSLFLLSWLTSPPSRNLAFYTFRVVHQCRCAKLLTPAGVSAPRTANPAGMPGGGRESHHPSENWGHSSGCIFLHWMAAGVMGKCTPNAPSSRESNQNWSTPPTLLCLSVFLFISVLK